MGLALEPLRLFHECPVGRPALPACAITETPSSWCIQHWPLPSPIWPVIPRICVLLGDARDGFQVYGALTGLPALCFQQGLPLIGIGLESSLLSRKGGELFLDAGRFFRRSENGPRRIQGGGAW